MKTVIKKGDHEVKLGVAGASDEVKRNLLADYYAEENGVCLRSYSANTPNIDKIAAAFERFGVDYVEQVYGKKPAQWQEALEAFIDKTKGEQVEWLLMGSCALAVRGIDLQPRGVDLMMPIDDLSNIRNLFEDCTIVPFAECPGWVCQGYGAAFLGAQISIGFGPQCEADEANPTDSGPFAMAHAEKMEWKGHRIYVPPIELSLNINKARGRLDRVALIKKYIADC